MQNNIKVIPVTNCVAITKGLTSTLSTHLHNKLHVWKTLVAAGHVLYTLNICLPNISYSNEVLLIFFSFLLPKKSFPVTENCQIPDERKTTLTSLIYALVTGETCLVVHKLQCIHEQIKKSKLSYWSLEYLYRWTLFQIKSLFQY